MSITSRTSGTSRLERTAELRIIASEAIRKGELTPASLPVVLYIARIHLNIQGFSEVYWKFIYLSPGLSGDQKSYLQSRTHPLGASCFPHPTNCAVLVDGASFQEIHPKRSDDRIALVKRRAVRPGRAFLFQMSLGLIIVHQHDIRVGPGSPHKRSRRTRKPVK